MENLITNQDITDFAPEIDLSQYSPTTISGMITQASMNVIRYCAVDGFLQSAVVGEQDRAHINSAGDLSISLRRRPCNIGDVSRIALVTVGVNQDLTLQSNFGNGDEDGQLVYFINNPGTMVIYPSNYLISFGRGMLALRGANLFYQIDYKGGYTLDPIPGYQQVPMDLKEATILYFRDIMAKRFNQFGMDSVRTGNIQMQTRRINGLTMFVDQARDILDQNGYVRRVP